ncbi:hypothetical protein GWN42_20640 [candidate division KSB1 bacterium]|nr:DUF3098 domain-containing protein [candidate division KSB1 bacterium]NIR71439.1 DUF3098 domain-containing protein [candidate division KSB1 bacterium]NIS23360.1 DUF3098 domain-containing protein [candidate division KSB1 bacterium]NIU23974.1 DUF3098 domain-containing protein [candidate division KSB1 bacterium]NIU92574.1 hypothetical protein [candidate division KSB1 bacterium]
MAQKIRKKEKYRGRVKKTGLPHTKRNYQLFGLAILVLLVGYWALAQPPVDGFLTLTLAPILLVIGYCVLIPVAILYSGKTKEKNKEQ